VTSFQCVADNLRQSFRVLAEGRAGGTVRELSGVSIASLGVGFQMFNAAFLSRPVKDTAALEDRLRTAKSHFDEQQRRWAFWICEDWLDTTARRKLSRTCEGFGLRLSSEMPGLAAERVKQPSRQLTRLDVQRVDSPQSLDDFRAVGATCFHVPIGWFSEVFDAGLIDHPGFICWVAYRDGLPVATAATVTANGVIGLYNVATAPDYRHRGYAETITRYAIDDALRRVTPPDGNNPVVLQSTSDGFRLYLRMGFQPVTRVLVYNSIP